MKKENGVTIVAMIVIFIAAMFIFGIIANLFLGKNNSYLKDYIIEHYTQVRNAVIEYVPWQKQNNEEEKNATNIVTENTTSSLNEYINSTNIQNSSWY